MAKPAPKAAKRAAVPQLRATIRPEEIIPTPFVMAGKYMFTRPQAEVFKKRLRGEPFVADQPPEVVEFVTLKQFADEVGRCVAQVKRWLKAAQAIRDGMDADEAHLFVSPKPSRALEPVE